MPDGTEVDWNYDTVRKIAMLLTVDKNGKDATEAGFDPENIVQYGFEPQRDDLRGSARTGGRARSSAATARPSRSPTPGRPPGSVLRRHVEGPLHHDRPAVPRAPTSIRGGYPFFSGKVAMSENFLWSTYGVADAGDDWDLAAIAVLQRPDDRRFNADTFRILKATKHPDAAFAVLLPARRRRGELLKLYGGMPARRVRAGRLPREPAGGASPQTSTGRSPRTASSSPTSRTSRRPCRSTTRRSTCSTRSARSGRPRQGLDIDAEIAALKAQIQAVWDQGGSLTR